MAAQLAEGVLLSSLLQDIAAVPKTMDIPVLGISADSRKVRPGDLFLALAGHDHHGLDFLSQVEAAGARAVLWEPSLSAAGDFAIPAVAVPALSRRAGEIASRFYGEPSAAQRVIGVTGTDGKTSCTHFIAEALTASGRPCGLIGTLGSGVFGALEPAVHTTPDAVSLHRTLADLRAAGAGRVAMEVSSHGLDQGRVGGVRFDTAVLTNLSRDHLDYHGTVEAYAAAKAKLFRNDDLGTLILNMDDALGRRLAKAHPTLQRVGFTMGKTRFRDLATLGVEDLELRPDGLSYRLVGDWGSGRVETSLLGRFNVANSLVAIAVLLTEGLPLASVLDRVSSLSPVPGRMQRLGGEGEVLAVVDYAHTPNALRHALQALREHGRRKLVCVFGCGGDRDRGKRPAMAAAAESLADEVIVTDDNPRGEDPDRIVAEIVSGFTPNAVYHVVRDRRSAIARALALGGAADTVLVAGKGHEDYQLLGDRRLPFSDAETVSELIGGAE